MKQVVYTLLLSAFLLTACGKSEETNSADPQPMKFAFYMKDGNMAVPVTRATPADLNTTGISLYCLYHTSPFANASTPAYERIYWNTPVDTEGNAADGVSRFWMSSPTAKYSFWAHSGNPKRSDYPALPSGTTGVDNWGVTGGNGGVANSQTPAFAFIQPDDPRQQIDFLVSDERLNMTANYMAPIIGLYFKHLLSRVKLRFYNSQASQLNQCKAQVTYKAGVKRGFDSNLGAAAAITLVNNRGEHGGTHPLHDGSFTVPSTATSPYYAFMAGDLILVPQTVADGFISVTLTYLPEGMVEERSATVDIPVPDSSKKLESGSAYTYDINIIVESNALKIGAVTLTAWEGQNSSVVDWTDY